MHLLRTQIFAHPYSAASHHFFLLLVLLLAWTSAIADDYADVNQLVKSGKITEAFAKIDVYLGKQPRDPQMRFIKGVIQQDIGKTVDAEATFLSLTQDYPELPEPHNNLAVIYAAQNDFERARAELDLAIRTNPEYSIAHENLGDTYAKLASLAYTNAARLDASNTRLKLKISRIGAAIEASAKPVATALPTATLATTSTTSTTSTSAAALPATTANTIR